MWNNREMHYRHATACNDDDIMLTIIRNAGQIPRGTSSPGRTIFNLDVIGMFSLPAYEKWGCWWLLLFCAVSSFIRIAFLSIRRFPCQPCFNWFFSLGLPRTAVLTTGGRGTLVDFTKTLTIPLFLRARWCGRDENEALAADERCDEQHCVDVDDATMGFRRSSGDDRTTSMVAFWVSPLLNNRGIIWILCRQHQRDSTKGVMLDWALDGISTRQLTSISLYWHAVRISESMVDGIFCLLFSLRLSVPRCLTTCCFWRTVSHADVITLPATAEWSRVQRSSESVLRPSQPRRWPWLPPPPYAVHIPPPARRRRTTTTSAVEGSNKRKYEFLKPQRGEAGGTRSAVRRLVLSIAFVCLPRRNEYDVCNCFQSHRSLITSRSSCHRHPCFPLSF